jgi:subtilisin family serine protease
MQATSLKRFRVVKNLDLVKLPAGVSVQEAVVSYQRNPDVLYAEPDYIVEALITPNDPFFGSQWNLYNTGQNSGTPGADIDALSAWNITLGSNDVVVAIIDTGVDYTHQDLAANMWRNTDCNSNGIDDDGNGFIDDCYGIDALNEDSDPMDDHNHGTHLAGIIGAAGNNSLGVVGINWNVSIMACKFLHSNGYGYTSDAIECMEYVKAMKDRGVNIVATNNSWGSIANSYALYDAIDAHLQRGILFIAAAGNGNTENTDTHPTFPASYYLPNVISVAATDSSDKKAGFSNYGRRTVHLGAPGREILSTTIGNTYAAFDGTSMAAPHVAGKAPGTGYQIKVTSTNNGYFTDASEGSFTIVGAPPQGISVISPNSRETWQAGTTQMIRWTYAGSPGNYLKIELLKAGVLNRTISNFASTSKGSYSWRIPATQAPGNDYRIRITSRTNPSCTDTSDSDFTTEGRAP